MVTELTDDMLMRKIGEGYLALGVGQLSNVNDLHLLVREALRRMKHKEEQK